MMKDNKNLSSDLSQQKNVEELQAVHYTWSNHTMEEACKDPNFFFDMVNAKQTLKENDKSGYYDQVPGQLAFT